jgi:hypothetical protein
MSIPTRDAPPAWDVPPVPCDTGPSRPRAMPRKWSDARFSPSGSDHSWAQTAKGCRCVPGDRFGGPFSWSRLRRAGGRSAHEVIARVMVGVMVGVIARGDGRGDGSWSWWWCRRRMGPVALTICLEGTRMGRSAPVGDVSASGGRGETCARLGARSRLRSNVGERCRLGRGGCQLGPDGCQLGADGCQLGGEGCRPG